MRHHQAQRRSHHSHLMGVAPLVDAAAVVLWQVSLSIAFHVWHSVSSTVMPAERDDQIEPNAPLTLQLCRSAVLLQLQQRASAVVAAVIVMMMSTLSWVDAV